MRRNFEKAPFLSVFIHKKVPHPAGAIYGYYGNILAGVKYVDRKTRLMYWININVLDDNRKTR